MKLVIKLPKISTSENIYDFEHKIKEKCLHSIFRIYQTHITDVIIESELYSIIPSIDVLREHAFIMNIKR